MFSTLLLCSVFSRGVSEPASDVLETILVSRKGVAGCRAWCVEIKWRGGEPEREGCWGMCGLLGSFFNKKLLKLKLRFYNHETVNINFSDSTRLDGNAGFTTVPLKLLSDKLCGRYRCFSRL